VEVAVVGEHLGLATLSGAAIEAPAVRDVDVGEIRHDTS
jgi:hypothetical protein